MLIYKKTPTLAVRHVFHPEALGITAEALVKGAVRAAGGVAVHEGARVLGHVVEEIGPRLAGDLVKKLTERVRDHFTDHSEALAEALKPGGFRAARPRSASNYAWLRPNLPQDSRTD